MAIVALQQRAIGLNIDAISLRYLPDTREAGSEPKQYQSPRRCQCGLVAMRSWPSGR